VTAVAATVVVAGLDVVRAAHVGPHPVLATVLPTIFSTVGATVLPAAAVVVARLDTGDVVVTGVVAAGAVLPGPVRLGGGGARGARGEQQGGGGQDGELVHEEHLSVVGSSLQ
jgi:hypothetical protein